jgi:hypothetical protein
MRFFRALIFCSAFTLFSVAAVARFYVSAMPAFYTRAGNTAERFTFAVEVGKQWDVFSLGIDIGKTKLTRQYGRDTTWYVELRSNLNVFQTGKFTNTLFLGLGYVPRAQENIMMEATTGIEYAINPQYHYNVFFGAYYFSGKSSASTSNFFGMSLVRYLRKKNKKAA